MRKNLLGLFIALLSFSTFGAFAQTESQSNAQACSEQTCSEVAGKCKIKDGKKVKGKGDLKKGKRAKVNPFDGIQLSADQQQKIDKLRAERKAKKESEKKADKDARAKDREAYNAELASILTPEQLKQYKANCDSIKSHRNMKAKVKAHKGQHKGKKEKR